MSERQPSVYILASKRMGTLYIGVTSNLQNRLVQHGDSTHKSFAGKYGVYRMVHCEYFDTMDQAIASEKQLKKWERAWKIRLIEENNPEWQDLAEYL